MGEASGAVPWCPANPQEVEAAIIVNRIRCPDGRCGGRGGVGEHYESRTHHGTTGSGMTGAPRESQTEGGTSFGTVGAVGSGVHGLCCGAMVSHIKAQSKGNGTQPDQGQGHRSGEVGVLGGLGEGWACALGPESLSLNIESRRQLVSEQGF